VNIINRRSSPRYVREEGIVSYLLVSPRTCASKHLTTTFVEIKPGGWQREHSHAPEQVYHVLEGSGLMTVGNETARVGPGDCIFIPSGTRHGLTNDGQAALKYLSAAAPSFRTEQLEEFWPLESEAAAQRRCGNGAHCR
jgi:mannose-6-phosphate isomerase-like protein (cupin superfamily)